MNCSYLICSADFRGKNPVESMISQRVTEIHSVSDLETCEALIPNAASIINLYKHKFTRQTKGNNSSLKKNKIYIKQCNLTGVPASVP